MSGALTGYRILDLTQGLCGPFGAMRLGDAGAEIVKLEPLDGGCRADYGTAVRRARQRRFFESQPQ